MFFFLYCQLIQWMCIIMGVCLRCSLKSWLDWPESPGCVRARGPGSAGRVEVAAILRSSEQWPGLCSGWRSGRYAGWSAGSRSLPSCLEERHVITGDNRQVLSWWSVWFRFERVPISSFFKEIPTAIHSEKKVHGWLQLPDWMLAHHPVCSNSVDNAVPVDSAGPEDPRHAWLSLCCTVWLHNWPCATRSTLNQQCVIDLWGSWGPGGGCRQTG